MLRLVCEFGISAARVIRDIFSEAIGSHSYIALWQQLYENSPISREHTYIFLSSGRHWNSSHCKSFSALSLNMMSRNPILTAVHGTKTRASQLAMYCNSSDRCIVCRHARRSECWVTSIYMSHLIWNRPWQQAAGLRLAGTLNLHRPFVFLAWLTTCYSRCWSWSPPAPNECLTAGERVTENILNLYQMHPSYI